MKVLPLALVALGVLCTVVAQILLKKASVFDIKSTSWVFFMGAAAMFYVTSFIAYSRILKYYPLNRIYAAMTIVQLVLIMCYGLWIGEVLGTRQAAGVVLGLISVYLILS